MRKSFYTDYQALHEGKIVWCRVSATTVDYAEDGSPAHILALLQDVDVEKAKEAEYQARILKEAQDAKIANNAKSEFLRHISHDIRIGNLEKSTINTAATMILISIFFCFLFILIPHFL